MFTRVPLVLAAVLAATAIATACEPLPHEELPPRKSALTDSPSPQVATVIALDGKSGTVEYSVVVPVPVRAIFAEPPVFRVTGWTYQRVVRTAKMDQLQFSDATGKRLTTEEVWKRLTIGTAFFVSTGPVPAEYLNMIARDALVAVDNTRETILEQMQPMLTEDPFQLPS